MEKSTIRLRFPLTFSLLFIFIVVGSSPFFDTLGFWKYIIAFISGYSILWLLDKFKITEKRVGIGVGLLIFLLGIIIGITCDVFISQN